jgi:hypothetical protein
VSNDPARPPRRVEAEAPTHPRMKAALLMIGVVVAIIAFAAMSTFGSH